MKKLQLFILALVLAIFVSFAMADTEEPVNTSIDSSTWTAIALDGSTPCSSYMFQLREAADFKWKKTAASTNYFTIKSGGVLVIDFARERTPTTLFYAQSASGTPTVEVFVFNEN